MKQISKRGVTIVTLVITVIILIILTGAVMLTMNETNIFGQTQTTVDAYSKQATIEQIRLKIQTKKLKKINDKEGRFTYEEDVIPILREFGTYEENKLKLTTDEKNIQIYLYEIMELPVKELLEISYEEDVLIVEEKVSLRENGYKYEYTTDNGNTWAEYTGEVTVETEDGIKVRIVNSENEVVSKEETITGGIVVDTSLQNISILQGPSKTEYKQGESFAIEGMIVAATYGDGRTEAITNYIYSPSGALTVNDKYVTIEYTEEGITKQTTQRITVTNKVTQIEVKTLPDKTKYVKGESFNPYGLEIEATYEDGNSKVVTDYSYSPVGALDETNRQITITYEEEGISKTTTIEIEVTNEVASIEVIKQANKVQYRQGESFEPNGIEIEAIYEDGTREVITDYTYSPSGKLTPSDTSITITYEANGKEITTTQAIKVSYLNSIEVTSEPRTEYVKDEDFDASEMIITAIYMNNDGTSYGLEVEDYKVIGGEKLQIGTDSVTIEYTEEGITKQKSISIEVRYAIYAIKREIDNESSSWERIEDSVGLEANATFYGTLSGRNDFDNLAPWSEIKSYNYDPATDTIKAWYGDSGYKADGSNGDVLTYVPEFWYKRIQENGYEYIYITEADPQDNTYTKSEEFSMARYETYVEDGKAYSRSGVVPTTSTSLNDFRTITTGTSNNYCLMDYRYFTMQMLYLVEYADYNSQAKLGNGYTYMRYSSDDKALVAETNTNRIVITEAQANNFVVGQEISVGTGLGNKSIAPDRTITGIEAYSENGVTGKAIEFDGEAVNIAVGNVVFTTAQKTGSTDSLGMKSGTAGIAKTSGAIYRGIENIFGNTWTWVDGINIKSNEVFVCYNPTQYTSSKFESPYVSVGTMPSSQGYQKTVGYNEEHPLITYPLATGGSSSTYVTDYYYTNSGADRAPCCGRQLV